MIIELNEKNFEQETAKGLKLVTFSAQWCHHCKRLKVELDQLDKIWIGYVDSDKDIDLTRKFKISAYPTMIIFKDGKEVERIIGYHTKEKILTNIMQYLI